MLTTLAAPAFAGTWCIDEGNITVKAGDTKGKNTVSQGNKKDVEDTNTIITGTSNENTVTIDTSKGNVDVTFDDLNIDASSRNEAAVSVTGSGNTTIKLDGDNHLTGGISDNGSYGLSGISSFGGVTISSGGTVTATGGNSTGIVGYGGSGIYSSSGVAISGGAVTANGGDSKDGYGGNGISSTSTTISGGTVTANGGSDNSSGGNGIRSFDVAISGGTVKAAGGNGGYGGNGIIGSGRVAISGGTVNAAGGDGGNGKDGGYGIISRNIDLSGSLELTAKAGSPNGKALSQDGNELDLDTIKDKLDPGAKVTTTDADGKVNQVSISRPVEPEKPVIPEESSSSSDGGSSAPSAPVSPLPGLTVTDKDGQRISYTSTQSGNTLTVCVGRFTASLHVSLAALRQLRAEGIETIAFQTILCSTTLSVDELLAMGGEDAEAVLTHRLTDSSLTVG